MKQKQIRKFTYATNTTYIQFPELRLRGKWLKDLYGINVGDPVNLIYLPDKIIIQPVAA